MQDSVVGLGCVVDDSTEGLLSLSSVTGGKSVNDGPSGQVNTPGPGPNPQSARPAPPQKKQFHKTGITVS